MYLTSGHNGYILPHLALLESHRWIRPPHCSAQDGASGNLADSCTFLHLRPVPRGHRRRVPAFFHWRQGQNLRVKNRLSVQKIPVCFQQEAPTVFLFPSMINCTSPNMQPSQNYINSLTGLPELLSPPPQPQSGKIIFLQCPGESFLSLLPCSRCSASRCHRIAWLLERRAGGFCWGFFIYLFFFT